MVYKLEKDFQSDCISFIKELQKLKYLIEYDHLRNLNRYGKRIIKQDESIKGQPDLKVYLPGGKTLMIELKRDNGTISEDQEKKLEKYYCMGFKVFVIKGDLELFKKIILRELGI